MAYHSFIVYHDPSDRRLARTLHRALSEFARPWNRRAGLRVFCVRSAILNHPWVYRAIAGRIDDALAQSDRLVLVASSAAAGSERVAQELESWLEDHGPEAIVLVLSEGELVWDPASGNFDREQSTALPPLLQTRFQTQPHIVDLRWARVEPALSERHSRFRGALLELAARLAGRPPEVMEAEDLRQHRRRRLLGRGLVALLSGMVVAAAWQVYEAQRARDMALERLGRVEADLAQANRARLEAERQAGLRALRGPAGTEEAAEKGPSTRGSAGDRATAEQLAAAAQAASKDGGMTQGLLLAVESLRRYPTLAADQVLHQGLARLLRPVVTLAEDSRVVSAAFSGDGKYLVSGDQDGLARAWEVAEAREASHAQHEAPVRALAVSPDGRWAASADEEGTVRVWALADAAEVTTLRHPGALRALAFSPDGTRLASAGEGGVRLWQLPEGGEVQAFPHEGPVAAVAYSLSGDLLISADGPSVRVRDLRSGGESPGVRHEGGAEALALSPDGRYLVTGGADRTARIWDRAQGHELARLEHRAPVVAVAYSLDGTRIATASGRAAQLWDAATYREIGRMLHGRPIADVAFSLDGRFLVTAGAGGFRIWLAHSAGATVVARHDDLIQGLVFDPSGRRLVTAGWDRTARSFELASGRELSRMEHPSLVAGLARSPDGKFLATASGERAYVWELDSGVQTQVLEHGDAVNAVAFSPDGGRLATAGGDGAVRIRVLADGREALRLDHGGAVLAATFSPDGALLASGGQDGSARVWDGASGAQIALLQHEGPVQGVAFSPDGQRLATASLDRSARIWEARNGKELLRLRHEEAVQAVLYSHDGAVLASAGWDRTARLWDAAAGTELARLAHEDPVLAVAFSADQRQLASASGKTGALWIWRAEDLISEICARLTRNLTVEEWEAHLGSEPYRPTCATLPAATTE